MRKEKREKRKDRAQKGYQNKIEIKRLDQNISIVSRVQIKLQKIEEKVDFTIKQNNSEKNDASKQTNLWKI